MSWCMVHSRKRSISCSQTCSLNDRDSMRVWTLTWGKSSEPEAFLSVTTTEDARTASLCEDVSCIIYVQTTVTLLTRVALRWKRGGRCVLGLVGWVLALEASGCLGKRVCPGTVVFSFSWTHFHQALLVKNSFISL